VLVDALEQGDEAGGIGRVQSLQRQRLGHEAPLQSVTRTVFTTGCSVATWLRTKLANFSGVRVALTPSRAGAW
jgi:hypothetical protein